MHSVMWIFFRNVDNSIKQSQMKLKFGIRVYFGMSNLSMTFVFHVKDIFINYSYKVTCYISIKENQIRHKFGKRRYFRMANLISKVITIFALLPSKFGPYLIEPVLASAN